MRGRGAGPAIAFPGLPPSPLEEEEEQQQQHLHSSENNNNNSHGVGSPSTISLEIFIRYLQAASLLSPWFEVPLGQRSLSNIMIQKVLRRIIILREKMSKYFRIFGKEEEEGPSIWPMHLEQGDGRLIGMKKCGVSPYSQWTIRGEVIVAPIFNATTYRNIYLPSGEWVDLMAKKFTRHVGPKCLRRYSADIYSIPVFERPLDQVPLHLEL